jgi:hypothetical protein
VLLAGIRRARERSAAAIPEFMIAPPRDLDDIQPYFDERAPGYAAAHSILRARDLHGSHVVDAILEELRAGDRDQAGDG